MVSIERLCYTARHSEYSELEASIAQLVEQRIRNAKVVGSIPITGTIYIIRNNGLQGFCDKFVTKPYFYIATFKCH